MPFSEIDTQHMRRALELAARGQGAVEPNPMVGCVIARDEQSVGEGFHGRFGGPHAEIEALTTAGFRATGATLYVTLEPCCHFGKTPPCTAAIIAAGMQRVVIAASDPFPAVSGGGIAALRGAGIEVQIGLLAAEARQQLAPYLKLTQQGRPWVIVKWAMTLDGKLATRSGDSRWISNETSREIVHALRGRMDAIIVGRGTALTDDPLLTARPAGRRVATRIVVDSRAMLPLTSQLVKTARETPVLIAAGPDAMPEDMARLTAAGCEVWQGAARESQERLGQLLDELGRRRMTNVLVEGGSQLLGSLWDGQWIDEIHAFIAPKLVGGSGASSPLAGLGVENIAAAHQLHGVETQLLGDNIYVRGMVSGVPATTDGRSDS